MIREGARRRRGPKLLRSMAGPSAILLLTLLLPRAGLGQEVEASPAPGTMVGTVVDATSEEPLSGAAVSIAPRPEGLVPGADGGTGAFPARDRTVLTDEDGRYRFAGLGEGEYLLRISRLGYRSATVTVGLSAGREASVSVGLRMEPVRLTPVSIAGRARNPYGRERAAGLREEVTERPGSVHLRQQAYLGSDVRALTHEEVLEANTAGETDLFRALQRLPGVGTVDDWTALLHVRGGRWDATRVYFDGLPLYHPLHVGSVLSAVNADAVGTLFFHPGVRPPDLGGGSASVIDVASRRGGGDGTGGYGELSLLSARLALDRSLFGGRGGLMVAARRSFADLLVPLFVPEEDGGFPYAVSDVTGRFDLDLGGSGSLEASVLWEKDDLFGDLADVAQGSRADWGNLAARVTWRGPILGLRGRHTLGMSRYALELDSVPPDPDLARRFSTSHLEPTDSRLRHLVLRGVLQPWTSDGSGPGWKAGYEAVSRSVRYGGPVPVLLPGLSTEGRIAYRDALHRGAVWGEHRWRPAAPLEMRAGLRVEAGEAVENAGAVALAPRLRARFRATPDLTLSAAAGRHFQHVQSMAQGGGHPGGSMHPARGWRLAGGGTPALRTDIVTVGGELWLGSRWLAGATAYRRWSDGILTPAVREGPLEAVRLVDGRESARGVEVSVRRLAGRWTVAGSYSYGLADRSAAGVSHAAPSERRHLVDLTTAWRPTPGLRIGAAYSAGSGAALTRVFNSRTRLNEEGELVPTEPRMGTPGGARGPGYATLDLTTELTAGFDDWSLAVYFQLRNALGRDNDRLYTGSRTCEPERRPFLCQSADGGVIDHFEMSLPTVPLLGFRVAF